MTSRRPLPPPLAPAVPGSFAQRTLRERLPRIVGEVLETARLAPAARARLRRARDRLPEATVRRLAPGPGEGPLWDAFFRTHAGRRLAELPFFELEAYFYLWVLTETGYFETGADPFSAAKRNEFAASVPSLEAASRATLQEDALAPRRAVRRALQRAVLGNHADASNPEVLGAGPGGLELAQHVPWRRVEGLLLGGPKVVFLADNAMSELWYDLVLARSVVRAAPAIRVELVLKRHPLFVSDAVPGDVEGLWELAEAQRAAPGLRRLTRELRAAVDEGRIAIRSWSELNAPLHFSAPELSRRLDPDVPLVLMGDANYRRALEDRAWPPTTPLGLACRMPARRVLFLRVMKSECVAGLPAPLVRRLERADRSWRTDGRYAISQLLQPRGKGGPAGDG